MAVETAKTSSKETDVAWQRQSVISLAKAYFVLAVAYAGYIIVSDAWNLVARQLTFWRWEMFGGLLITTALAAYLARERSKSAQYYQALVFLLILAGIALATFAVYTERGMASRAVVLYAVPIVSTVVLLKKRTVFVVSALSTAAYTLAVTRYFYINFNEGFKIELYSTLAFYSAVFFVLAAVVSLGNRQNNR